MQTEFEIEQRLVWNRMAYVANRVATALVLVLGTAMLGIMVWTVGNQVEHYATEQVWLAGSFADAFGLKLEPALADIQSLALREALLYLGTKMHVSVPCGTLFMFLGLAHFLLADGFRRIQTRWAKLNFDLMYVPLGSDRVHRSF